MQRLTNEYRLLRRLGSGGMGEVWEAARVKNDIVVPCAIKLLHADFTETASERRLFFDEARIATQLDHSRIVKVIDLSTAQDGRPFLVMERVDGVDLRHFLKAAAKESSTPLEVDLVAYIVGEVLAALAYAHQRTVGTSDAGIIHSDVTPGNILISSSGEVKLTDFGIARFAALAAPMSRAIGTPRYMSPEQLSGHPRRETDIYGLGVVLHELVEDARFLEGLTPDQFRSRVLTGPPPPLTRKDVPAWLDELRQQMLATDPSLRPQAADARATLIANCPGYAAASARLEADYARLIGRRRSGVTQLVEENLGDTAFVPPPAGAEEPACDTQPGAEDASSDEEVEVAPTELLPTTQPSSSHPANLRWLALASALAAMAMLIVALTLLMQMLREPVDELQGHVAEVEPPSARSPPRPEPTPEEPTVSEPTVLARVVDPEPGDAEPEPTADREGAPEPDPQKPKAEPAPKALPKVGVVFVIETDLEGQLKAGRKVVAVKNRSGYAELSPGKYQVGWRPEGSQDWQRCGRVTIPDVAPSHYKVRIDQGKVVEVGKL